MKTIAIIGLGSFGIRMLNELNQFTHDIIIIDNDSDCLAKYREQAQAAHEISVFTQTALRKCLPPHTETVIVDFVKKIEVSVMITTYLKAMGIKEIVVKASSDSHGNVLSSIGATQVIFPDREAAKQIVPQLASLHLFNFMPVSDNFAIGETAPPKEYIGKTLAEANVRKLVKINVLAVRKSNEDTFLFINDPDYMFAADDVLLIAGSQEAILNFSNGKKIAENRDSKNIFRKLFPKRVNKDST